MPPSNSHAGQEAECKSSSACTCTDCHLAVQGVVSYHYDYKWLLLRIVYCRSFNSVPLHQEVIWGLFGNLVASEEGARRVSLSEPLITKALHFVLSETDAPTLTELLRLVSLAISVFFLMRNCQIFHGLSFSRELSRGMAGGTLRRRCAQSATVREKESHRRISSCVRSLFCRVTSATYRY